MARSFAKFVEVGRDLDGRTVRTHSEDYLWEEKVRAFDSLDLGRSVHLAKAVNSRL